jgi:hypothetical protein
MTGWRLGGRRLASASKPHVGGRMKFANENVPSVTVRLPVAPVENGPRTTLSIVPLMTAELNVDTVTVPPPPLLLSQMNPDVSVRLTVRWGTFTT